MTDLATLGLRIESVEAELADNRLNKLEKSAMDTERAADALAMAARGLGASLNPVLASIDASVRELLELQRAQHAVAAVSDLVTSEVVQEAAAVQALTAEVQQASTAHMQFSASANVVQSSLGGMASEFRQAAAAAQQADAHMTAYRQHMAAMPPVIGQADAHMLAYRNQLKNVSDGIKLTAHDMLNLTRQGADVGVTLAMGMNPFMVALQQGPQIFDGLQVAAIRSEATVSAVMRAMGVAIWTAVAPLLPFIAAIGLAIGALAGVTALSARSMNKEFGDLTVGMGLTEKQLENLQNKGVTMGDVIVGTLKWIGDSIWNLIGPAVSKIGEWFSIAMDWATSAVVTANKVIAGVFLGTFRGIQAVWTDLPAVLGDAAISAANAVIRAIENMLNRAGAMFNQFLPQIRMLMAATGNVAGAMNLKEFGQVDLPELNNPYAGAAREAGVEFAEAFSGGMKDASSLVDRTIQNLRDSIKDAAEERIRREAGEAERGRNGGSGGTSEAERLARDTQRYIDSLKEQAATVGMNAIQAKEYEIAQQAMIAPTVALRREVERSGAALVEKMKAEATNTQQMDDAIAMLELERRMIGATNTERAVALAQLAEAQRLKAIGVNVGDDGYDEAIARAGDLARATENLRTEQDRYNDSLRLSLDLARQTDDIMRDAASGFADAFGDAGKAIGGILTSMTGLNATLKQIDEEKAERARNGLLTTEREILLEQQRASATIGAYGDMLSAARGYFAEGSDGYKALMIVEQAYRAFQLASSIASIAQGWIETSQSVAQSGVKGTASAAAGAAKMFEILGPLGFPVVAAMLGLLAGLGLGGLGGGGGSKGAANDDEGPDHSTNAIRSYTAQDALARDQAQTAIAQKLEVRVTADREGLNAYVVGTAQREATGIAAPMVAAAAAGTKREIFQTMNDRQVGNRKVSV